MVKPSNRKPEHVKLKLISSFWWLWFSWSLFTFSMEKKKMIMFKQAKESAAVSANDILSISENKYWNYGLSTHHVCVKTFKFGWRNNITNMWTALRGENFSGLLGILSQPAWPLTSGLRPFGPALGPLGLLDIVWFFLFSRFCWNF